MSNFSMGRRRASPYVYEGSWAGRPAADAVPVRSQIRITSGFGATGRSAVFETDGTYWRPLNGRAMLAAFAGTRAAPISTLVGNGATQVFTLPSNILVPAGALFPSARVGAMMVVIRSAVGAAVGWNFHMTLGGTPNLTTGAVAINSASVTNTVGSVGMLNGATTILSSTQTALNNYHQYNGSINAVNSADATSILPTIDAWVRASVGSEGNASDTMSLLSFAAWLEA